ncbi:MAG: MATE family efflux transporter [Ruminococcaceae bacterium]|nr:MATE family efflux transporter [Oscillospiraceae bacterium]
MAKEKIQLSDHFTYSRLVRFVIPSVVMMIFTSIYGVVDGLFVSNFVGKTPFAAINLVFPLIMILGGFGFMLGTGGTAIVAKTLGMGEKKLATEYFTFIIISTAVVGTVLALLGIAFARPVAMLLGAEGEILECAVVYSRVVLMALPFFMLQNSFQNFFITAEKPKLGLAVTVAAGVTNMVLDAIFIAVFGWGLVGAAAATAISQFVGGIVPVIYFASKNKSVLRFCKTRAYFRVLLNACTNGSSELLSNISASVVTILYNFQLLRFAGEDGIAAYGVIMYVAFVFVAIFIGFVIGAGPIVSFHYGANNTDELKSIRKKSTVLVLVSGAAMLLVAILLSKSLCTLFVGYDVQLYEITHRGFVIYAVSYLFAGYNIFGSSFFTALNNGLISAIISFLRTLVFQTSTVLLLPMMFAVPLDGVWFSVIVAEALSFAVTAFFICIKKKQYDY